MRVEVDLTLCQGHGRCYLLVPEVFEPGDDYGHSRVHAAVDPESEPELRLGHDGGWQ